MGPLIKELLRLVRSKMTRQKDAITEPKWPRERSTLRATASSFGRLFSEVG
jgi:hypothetical protein